MEIITFLLIIISLILVGIICQLLFIDRVDNHFELFSLSFPIGLGLSIIFILTTSTFMDIREAFVVFNTIFLVAAIIIKKKLTEFLLQAYSKVRKLQITEGIGLAQKNKLNSILGLIIIFAIGIVIYKNATWPIIDWDAISNYDFLAKIWYQADSINPFKKGITILNPGLIWPKFVSIMHIFAYWAFGLGNQGKIINSFLLVFYTLIIFVNFKEKYNFTVTLLFTLLVLTAPLWGQSMMAYTNFPFSVFFIIALIYLAKHATSDYLKKYYLFVGLVTFLISLWIRESFSVFHLFTALALGILSVKKKQIRTLPIILVIIVFGSMWLWDRIEIHHLAQIDQSTYKQFIPEKGERLYMAKPSFGEIFTTPEYLRLSRFWEVVPFALNIYKKGVGIYLAIYIVLLVYIVKFGTGLMELLNSKNFILLWLLIFFSLFFVGLYISSITLYRYWYAISGSALRMISFIPPLVLFVALNNHDIYLSLKGLVEKLWKKVKL